MDEPQAAAHPAAGTLPQAVVDAIARALEQIGRYGTITMRVERGQIVFVEYTGKLKIEPAPQTE